LSFVLEANQKEMVMMRATIRMAIFAALAAGCAAGAGTKVSKPARPTQARAVLHDASGAEVGRARLQQAGKGIRVTIQVTKLAAGTHGVHVHAAGRCDGADFASAGPHWNPTNRQHGKDNPAGMHKGDLPNIVVGTNGRGNLGFTVDAATLGDLLDADKAAIVVHAAADDYRTDPSGNSGARIACGVLSAS
jgi:Cu-Zn family superoxide dismutase